MTVERQEGIRMNGRIEVRTYNVDELRDSHDDWDSLDKATKIELLSNEEPDESHTTYNVTTDRLHEYFVDNLDPNETAAEDNVDIDWMAIGTDGASGTSTSNTDLNSRQYSEAIDSHANNSKDLVMDTLVGSSEGNGNTYDEIGVFTGDPANLANSDVFMCNHATFSSVTKDSSKSVTFQVTLSFSDV